MPDNTLAAWVVARLLRGEIVDGNIIAQIDEPYRAIAQALIDRNGRAASREDSCSVHRASRGRIFAQASVCRFRSD